MGRTWTADGKRVSLGLKVSEAKAAAVDAARGETPRALWLAGLIDAALEGGPVQAAATKRQEAPEPRTEPDEPSLDPIAALRAQIAGLGVPLTTASQLGSAPEPVKRPCRHPSAAVRDNVCECGADVW